MQKYRPYRLHQAYFAMGFIFSFLFVWLYTFALIEAKYSIFLQVQPFRTGRPLTGPEEVLFVAVFTLELLALSLGISFLLWSIYRRKIVLGRYYAAWMIPISVVFVYFILITVQFQVLRYFKDGLDMVLIRQLGGGDIWSAVHFAINELAQLLPLIAVAMLAVGASLFLLARFGARITDYFAGAEWVRSFLAPRILVTVNLVLFVGAFLISYNLPVLNKNLGYSLAHQVYAAPWKYLTDFDRDGFGMVPRPVDQAPLDPARHPYAKEILANGIDENGIGGDLEGNIWHQVTYDWTGEQLEKRNVILLVLESARSDLYKARHQGEWVMPELRSLPGQELNMIAHTAFTASAIVSLFNGIHSGAESAPSLIDRFNELGYRTGVFSAQNENFGKQDKKTGMQRAGYFYDSRSESPDHRMYMSSSKIASAIPAPIVLSRLESWLKAEDPQPFFAYLNFQELHFPYASVKIDNSLIEKPIPRYAISEKETDWLRATYYNAARSVDTSIARLVAYLKHTGLFENTVVLVVGDHGEELFDFGSLGHGTEISFEQNSTLGKLINSAWFPDPNKPLGQSEVPNLIHNALVRDEQDILPLDGYALALLGTRKPLQIGLFTKDGLTKYDFRKDNWTQQSAFGVPQESSSPDLHLIHLWESYILSIDGQDN